MVNSAFKKKNSDQKSTLLLSTPSRVCRLILRRLASVPLPPKRNACPCRLVHINILLSETGGASASQCLMSELLLKLMILGRADFILVPNTGYQPGNGDVIAV